MPKRSRRSKRPWRDFPRAFRCICWAAKFIACNGRDRDAAGELGSIDRLIQERAAAVCHGGGVRHRRGGSYLISAAPTPARCSTSFTTSPPSSSPTSSRPISPRPSWPSTRKTTPWRRRRSARRRRPPAEDPRFHYLLARALSAEDRAGSAKALAEALKINPRHVDSLLLQADQLIDAERYAEAEQVLKQVLDVNPHEPRAWAYRAVLAHLRGDRDGEAAARRSALAPWATNPEVDHLIGRKLSQKYRFAEGAALPEAGARARPRLPARQGPALPGPAPAGRRGRGLEARCRDLQQGWL